MDDDLCEHIALPGLPPGVPKVTKMQTVLFCVLPLQQRRGVHNRRAERGVNCLEDERPKIVLLKKLSLYGATTLFLSVLHSKGAAVQKHQW